MALMSEKKTAIWAVMKLTLLAPEMFWIAFRFLFLFYFSWRCARICCLLGLYLERDLVFLWLGHFCTRLRVKSMYSEVL